MKQANDFMPRVTELIEASITTKPDLFRSRETLSTIAKVSELLVSALRQGDKVLLFGNGGSAADAQHIAAELVGRFFFFQAEDGIRDDLVTGVQTCALPI